VKKVVLAGNATTAEILCAYLRDDPRYEVAGLTVDDAFAGQGGVDGYRTVGLSSLAKGFPASTHGVIMAMGYDDLNRARAAMFDRLASMGYAIETYFHPDARIHTTHPVGEGSVVLPGAVIEPHARVGRNTMVWSNVTLAHHSNVGDHCWVAAGTVVSGQATVSHHSFLGVNSAIVNGVSVGEFNIVGAGAMISRSTKPYTVHLARSAEPFRYSSEDYVKHFGV
jgi:sugar O-acyltransferase (sialic acid O-acetyltransferase NeuD family)